MSTILFLTPGATGHFNASLKISIPLKKRGHKIVYGSTKNLKYKVESHGFNFAEVQLFDEEDRYLFRTNKLRYFFYSLLDRITNEKWNRNLARFTNISTQLIRIGPDIIFIDSFYSYSYIICHKYDFKCIFVQTQIPTEKTTGIPPLTSSIIPTNSSVSRLRVKLAWKLLFLIKATRKIKSWFLAIGCDEISLIKKTSKYFDIPFDKIFNEKSTFYPCIKNIPEVVTVPKEFDFKRIKPENRYYVNSIYRGFESRRTYKSLVHDSISIISAKKNEDKNLKFIYCSLGTLRSLDNKNYRNLIKKIIKAVDSQKSLFLVISVGSDFEQEKIGEIPANVKIYNEVPQLELLSYCDVMITHGGTNSIIECIYNRVPLLVYPLDSTWDQPGNTARVLYHEIGIKGNFKSDTVIQIREKLNRLTSCNSFYLKIEALKKRMDMRHDLDDLFQLVES